MSIRRGQLGPIFSVLLAGAFVCGCVSPQQGGGGGALGDSGNNGMVYAANWSEIAIDANLSNTKVLSTGHFETTHNACNREADAAMSLADWNDFAGAVNSALQQYSKDATPFCFDVDPTWCMDGKATIVFDDGTQETLFEPGDYGQTCTRIQDRDLAQKLFKAINGITYAADHTDCTLEWERCSR